MSKKSYWVNWSIAGVDEIKAKSEDEAREIVESWSKEELLNKILGELHTFEVGTVEEC